MRSQVTRRIVLLFLVCFAIGLCFSEAGAQRRRSKRSRRVTNPVVSVPVPAAPVPSTQSTDPQIISTADQQAADQSSSSEISGQLPANSRRTNRGRPVEPQEEDSVRRTVSDLSAQVTKLTEKLTLMERQQRTLVDLERLTRAEQRAEAIRTQMRDVQDKEGNLMARMEQLEYDLKPENIERSVATYGSTRPEDARDARRRALESERVRVRSQLDLLATSRQRLETAIITADMEVDKLRRRIEEATEPPAKTDTTGDTNDDTNETEGTSTTVPTTVPRAPNSTTPPR